ncbi:hypothetical protein BGW36DRAFT_371570 [Talaromyces proteolyticus]|uniref:Uncharacterized protein n=1 Tax=Talaromyces proteolyticus TaxID=1131652 RepID=A0AAD4KWL0_9EURO|nr:uncharacterized protein BGW36DRAFT_371570 [Talaromyces proteolyticus]KAH8701784.1 hypothetical protein BGW36DRAFT_371570 [Talaromyces proteolyticus]
MVLLTSSTVATLLVPITCICTFSIFLAGYALQQHSVRKIQDAMRPLDSIATLPQQFSYDETQETATDPATGELITVNKGNFAYLQLLSEPNPSDICSAILFFKKLADGQSVIQDRLFMYPQEWDLIASSDPNVNMALSILSSASQKYSFWTLPISMKLVTEQGYSLTDSKLFRLGEIQFLQYDSVLYLRTPGLLLNAQELDKMLLRRPLPLKYDKNRVESFRNEAWIGMPLMAHQQPKLPPVYLVSVNTMPSRVEARTHIPNVALRGFGDLAAGPSYRRISGNDPAYVFFDWDEDGRVKWEGNPYYDQWRDEQSEVCPGLDLGFY